MARYGQRPENALKRAHEFIDVGKPSRALDTLSEVFRNKKWAYTWSESVLEPIMFKYLDLCVELKKSHIAKEGLFQYRNMFQSVNVSSLENVIRFYLKTAEDRTDAARNQSQQAVFDIEIDDLDNLATPESILLSAVSGDDAQDRSDRTILTPWVKFLWESYCQCLELLRTNVHVENLYHDIARMAFQFCLKYNRKTEFRKLCDKLRKHLEDICKLTPQVANVSISKPETQQLNLETRLFQLDSAIQMELWQEAYKAIEDIHGLMNMSKKSPVPKTMANYYQKLALVFWKAGNYLFHAAALFKLFQLSREMKKNMSTEELHKMACRVLLATLSIPLPSAHPEFDRFIETDKSPLEKAQRLATLLGLPQPPTRQTLLKDIVRFNVVALASKQLQDLYGWLEVEFNPLQLCERVEGVVESLVADQYLTQYIPALQDLTLVRLIQQVAQVYQTIEMSRIIELAKFTDIFHLERLLVDCVRHNDMQIRIDHGGECIRFGIDLAEAQREDKQEGPTLQIMPSEQIRNQLVTMMTVLHQAMAIINPNKKKIEREKHRLKIVQHYHESKMLEHQRILQRHKIIEDRKEYIERKNNQREEEEMRRQEHIQRQILLAEHKRLEAEREERERRRQENEIQQIKDRHLKEKMQQISQTAHGQKILKKLDDEDIKKLNAEQIAAKEAEELQKERRELQQKLKTQEKRVDYFERAKRQEEIPLLEKAFEEKEIQDRAFWEQQEKERIEALVEERELAVKCAERLKRMISDKDAFLEKLKSERKNLFVEKIKTFEKNLEEERAKRLAKRRKQRKEGRRLEFLREKEEEAERKRAEEEQKAQEEMRKLKEEEERLASERKAQQEELYRKEKEAKDRQARIQREREEEASRRAAEREKDRVSKDTADAPAPVKEKEPDSAWRRGGSARDDAPPAKSEPWRPSIARNRDADGRQEDSSWRSMRGNDDDRDRDRDRDVDRDRERDRDRGGFDRERDRGGYDRFDRDRDRDGPRGPDRDRDGPRSFDRDRDGPRGLDRDRDGPRGLDRDRDGPRGLDRDRDGPRGLDRDRDGPRGLDRDRDGPRGLDRDRDGPRGLDRDRDGPRGLDRDRDGPRGLDRDRGGYDRDGPRGGFDRDGPRSGYDRDGGRGGFDRDRDRDRMGRGGFSDRERPSASAGGGSWRTKTDTPDRPREPMGRDDDRRRDDDRSRRDDDRGGRRDDDYGRRDDDRGRRDDDRGRRDDDRGRRDEPIRRGPPRDDRGPPPSRDDWRGAPTRSKEPAAKPPPPREDRPPKPARQDGDDEWTTVASRR